MCGWKPNGAPSTKSRRQRVADQKRQKEAEPQQQAAMISQSAVVHKALRLGSLISGHDTSCFNSGSCAFVKDALYAKYKDIRTRTQLAECKREVVVAEPSVQLTVPREAVVFDQVASLEGEGLSRESAERFWAPLRLAEAHPRAKFKTEA